VSVLGLDLGEKRVGVAIAEPPVYVAVPLTTLDAAPWRGFIERLSAIVAERGVKTLVAGLPLHADGREGEAARMARGMAERIVVRLKLPLVFQDERYSSSEAERVLIATGKRSSKRKAHRDVLAAVFILEAHLRRVGKGA
jgi:putative Holliday junction resolvase